MSRIGRQGIEVPNSVQVDCRDRTIAVKGPKGELTASLPSEVNVSFADGTLTVSVNHPTDKHEKALWGTWASHIKNMVIGVTDGFEKELELHGVGYKVALNGKMLVLSVGFSHPVEYALPEDIDAVVEKNSIRLSGIDKQRIGQVAAEVRKIRPVEPYKGKGIKYSGEVVRRKAGKAAKGAQEKGA